MLTKAVPRDVRPRVTAAASPSPSVSFPTGSPTRGPSDSAPASGTPGSAEPSTAPSTGSTAGPGTPVRIPVPERPDRALVAVYRHEDLLSLAQKRNAFAADSGTFARVLASMAAAAAQQAATLRAASRRGAS